MSGKRLWKTLPQFMNLHVSNPVTGSYGTVYTCWNTVRSFNQEDLLVIKIIHIGENLGASTTSSKKAHDDAAREAQILRKLHHKVGNHALTCNRYFDF